MENNNLYTILTTFHIILLVPISYKDEILQLQIYFIKHLFFFLILQNYNFYDMRIYNLYSWEDLTCFIIYFYYYFFIVSCTQAGPQLVQSTIPLKMIFSPSRILFATCTAMHILVLNML